MVVYVSYKKYKNYFNAQGSNLNGLTEKSDPFYCDYRLEKLSTSRKESISKGDLWIILASLFYSCVGLAIIFLGALLPTPRPDPRLTSGFSSAPAVTTAGSSDYNSARPPEERGPFQGER